MYYPLIRKALFQLDPERAHEVTFRQLSRITGTPLAFLVRQSVPTKPVSCMGCRLKTRWDWPPVWIKTANASMRSARWASAMWKSAP